MELSNRCMRGRPCYLMPPQSFLSGRCGGFRPFRATRPTISGGPNFAYEMCARRITPEQRETLDLSSWDVAYNGAEPVRADTMKRFAATFASCGFRPSALLSMLRTRRSHADRFRRFFER